jgi:hypothetical protein
LAAKLSGLSGALISHLAYGGALSGGSATYDVGPGLDLDGAGTAYVAGFTKSVDFPTTDGSSYSGGLADKHAEAIVGL